MFTMSDQTLFQKAADMALQKPLATHGVRARLFAASAFLSGDFRAPCNKLGSIFNAVSLAPERLKHLKTLIMAAKKIDDTVDAMKPDDILSAGEAPLGTAISPFINNKNVCPPAYLQALEKLIEMGAISADEGISVSNYLAAQIRRRAEAEIRFNVTLNPSEREIMTETNMRLSAAYASFLFRCLLGNQKEVVIHSDADYDVLTERYPQLTIVLRLGQMVEDLRDLLIDMSAELQHSIRSPNWIITHAVNDGNYLNADGAMHTPLASFVAEFEKVRQPASFKQLPVSLQRTIERAYTEYAQTLSPVCSPLLRTFFHSFWRNSLSQGFHPANSNYMQVKMNIHAAHAQALP